MVRLLFLIGSGSIPLFPAFHGCAVLRFRSKLGKLDTHAIRIRNVRENRFGGADSSLAEVCSSLLEHRGRLSHVLDVDTEMIDSERAPIRGLQFDECILADLNVDERYISFVVDAPERFGKSQRLRIVIQR